MWMRKRLYPHPALGVLLWLQYLRYSPLASHHELLWQRHRLLQVGVRKDNKKKQRASSAFYLFHTLSIGSVLIRALTCCVTEREEQRRRERERRAPDESTKLRVRCDFFLHQRNEWHNEATPLNVREPSVALPEGLCRMAEGGNT